MPQLDPLIWINLCYNNTLFFWVIYYIVIRIVLIKTNTVFYIRNSLKEYSFLNTSIKINNLYSFNFIFIKKEINNIFILNKKRYLINIFFIFCDWKNKINNILFILSNTLNKNNYLFNNYYYNNYYYLFLLQNVNNNIKNNNSLNLNIIYNKDKFINFINN